MAKKNRTVGDARGTPKRNLEIVNVPLADLTLWDENPRKTDAAAKKLARIIAVHGFNSPLICTPDSIIRKGNTSYKAAEILGMETVPVIYIEFPSEEQAALYAIADNRAGEFSEWDPQGLAKLMGEQTGIPLTEIAQMTGFSEPEIQGLRDIRIELDEVKLPKEPKPAVVECPKCGHEFTPGASENAKSSRRVV